MSDNRVLVPVSQSRTLRQTVEYAVRTTLDGDGDPTVRFVYVHAAELTPEKPDDDGRETADRILDRASVWAKEDAGERDLTVETAHLGTDRYIFSPDEVADALATDARAHNIRRVVIDPEYNPGIGTPLVRPIEAELTRFPELTVEETPVGVRIRRNPLLERTSLVQMAGLFGISFVFYQILAGQLYWFDLVTGVVSATIVAIGLSRVVFSNDPTWQTLHQGVRVAIYIPYLLKEIIKANILVAVVILHPRLPIEPRMTHIRPALWGALPITTYANSVTLTPGTLSVRIDGRKLMVHTLLPAAREDLFDGGLERAVRFVFYGRAALSLSTPRERGETELIPANELDSETEIETEEMEARTEETEEDER